ncbi:MAG: hypothetical protein JNK33_05205 [Candidatus Doudnabacteria bacterium]|nr:hypothetical protein [Candidatus Doudnabacteria bacterium]
MSAFAEDDAAEPQEPQIVSELEAQEPSLTLTGKINLIQAGLKKSENKKAENGSGKTKIYMPCKIRKGKSGYKHVELAVAGGADWSQVVNHSGIPTLRREMLNVKR